MYISVKKEGGALSLLTQLYIFERIRERSEMHLDLNYHTIVYILLLFSLCLRMKARLKFNNLVYILYLCILSEMIS